MEGETLIVDVLFNRWVGITRFKDQLDSGASPVPSQYRVGRCATCEWVNFGRYRKPAGISEIDSYADIYAAGNGGPKRHGAARGVSLSD